MEVERAIRKVLVAIIATLLVSVFEGNDKQTIINLFQEMYNNYVNCGGHLDLG